MTQFNMGDQVFAAESLYNDAAEDSGESAIPGVAVGELLVAAGTRGVVVNVGHAEALPDAEIYLVRFEIEAGGVLSEPFGCLAEELSYSQTAG